MSNPFFVCTENFDLIKEAADELYDTKISCEPAYEVSAKADYIEGGFRLRLYKTDRFVKINGINSSKIRKIIYLLKDNELIENNTVDSYLWRGPIELCDGEACTPVHFSQWLD
jgi:hypothetical protein